MHWIERPGWPGNLVALLAGALTPLAFAPFGFWPLLLLGIGLAYRGLLRTAPGASLWRGWCYGFGLFVSGTSWIYVSIHDYGAASPLLAGFLTVALAAGLGLFFALPAWLWARFLRRVDAPLGNAMAFASLWLAQELFRGWFLTGFPWLYAGYSQLDGPLAGLAPLGGVWLVSLAVALSAAILADLGAIYRRGRGALVMALVVLVLPWGVAIGTRGHAWTTPAGSPLSVMLIQGNVAQELKWNPEHVRDQLSLYRDLTLQQVPADLIVWPENAIPVMKDRLPDYLSELDGYAREHRSALITGVPIRQPDAEGNLRYYNGLTVLGEGKGDYLKQKLVPFGEYVPLQDLLRGLIAFFDLPMSDFARGPAEQPLLDAKSYQIAPYICYEVVYPEFAAALAARSEILLTVSNDTWFGQSIGPWQHFQMARMRALESGRWMIRGTNNGVTALIDPFGQVSRNAAGQPMELPQFRKGILRGSVVPMSGETPYLRWRVWPTAIAALLVLLFAAARRRAVTGRA